LSAPAAGRPEPPTAEKPRRSVKRTIVLFVLGCVGIVGVAAVWIVVGLFRAGPGRPSDPPLIVYIERGWGLNQIAAQLERSGAVADSRSIILLARWRGLAGGLKAGEYEVRRGLPPGAVLDLLASGKTVRHYFTLPPGQTAAQAAEALRAAGVDPPGAARGLIDDEAFAKALGVPAAGLEGFLWPETYAYERGEDAKALLTRMVKQFQRVWAERFADRAAAADLNVLQIVTLASIVEKESGYAPERPLTARVFLNRLAAHMPLQADPTVIYALGADYQGKLTHADLQRDSPYNTYARPGLPPGPICNPSASAIEAILSPADGKWLYFVAAGEGRHVYTESYAEHQQAVQKYLKGR
jgi:UPF0755 protein